eukprot:CAMPEP_0201946212 /NCGR_PEP_ID=MMETSP0903-20130614/54303_1 /ASSEMBLY_ACC=CAM_ASM_000552 /TAXON_ID=420261 /ORGANISM="Thalassiosira antarctica, Strain CCMP982" /LENGTH=812 /DNA_ID=CAMNT_0048489307 /DNA_START=26 /DNA_END=2464 /DNA_ORIENTATION=+
MSIAVNCSNLEQGSYTYECSEGYTGSFANTFDFGGITASIESTDASTTIQVTEAAMTTTTGASTASTTTTTTSESTNAAGATNATEAIAMTSTEASAFSHSVDPAARAVDKEEFCQNLTDVESHMTNALMEENNSPYTSGYECACSDLETNDKSFTIDCSMEARDDGSDGNETFTEQMVFELKQGEYSLSQTSWGWNSSSVTWDSQEVYQLDDGVVTSCKANACTSCSVCEDNKSIAVDCSGIAEPGQWYVYHCGAGYRGSFANTFNFGVITGEEVEEEAPTDSTIDNSIDRDAFCQSLTDLESHMTESFEKKMRKIYTSSFECVCGALDTNDESFTVDCSTEGSDGGMTFVSSERMVFELNEGEYELNETSWSWEDSDGSHLPDQGVFNLENGAVTSCEANGCTSCTLCEDEMSIAVDCSNIEQGLTLNSTKSPAGEDDRWIGDGHVPTFTGHTHKCSEGYTGALSHSFDFGVISQTTSQPSSQPSPQSSSQPIDPAASAVDKEEFCKNLIDLEAHMNDELLVLNNIKNFTYTGSYECACSDLDMNETSFSVDCSLEGENVTVVRTEQMVFELNQGEYELNETSLSWKDSSTQNQTDTPQDALYWDGGVITSCKANGCTSCSLCEDKMSIVVDCSNLVQENNTYECSEGYKGSFAQTFDFGVITAAAESTDASTTTQVTEAAIALTTGATAASTTVTITAEPTNAANDTQVTEVAATTVSTDASTTTQVTDAAMSLTTGASAVSTTTTATAEMTTTEASTSSTTITEPTNVVEDEIPYIVSAPVASSDALTSSKMGWIASSAFAIATGFLI